MNMMIDGANSPFTRNAIYTGSNDPANAQTREAESDTTAKGSEGQADAVSLSAEAQNLAASSGASEGAGAELAQFMADMNANMPDLGEHYKGVLEDGFNQSFTNGARRQAENKEVEEKLAQDRLTRKQNTQAAAEADAEAASAAAAEASAVAFTDVSAVRPSSSGADSGITSTAALLDQLSSPNSSDTSSFGRRGVVAAYGRTAGLPMGNMAAYSKNA